MNDTQKTKIVVASKNPVKADAIRGAFERLFPNQPMEIEMVSAPSGVSDQPMSDEETRRGAENRVAAVKAACPDAGWWAGLEGGISDRADGADSPDGRNGMAAFAWIVVHSRTHSGAARTATFPLPPAVAELIRGGIELGEADDRVFGRENSKQKEGAIGILTGGLIDRKALYEHAAIMAMIPLKNAALFDSQP